MVDYASLVSVELNRGRANVTTVTLTLCRSSSILLISSLFIFFLPYFRPRRLYAGLFVFFFVLVSPSKNNIYIFHLLVWCVQHQQVAFFRTYEVFFLQLFFFCLLAQRSSKLLSFVSFCFDFVSSLFSSFQCIHYIPL